MSESTEHTFSDPPSLDLYEVMGRIQHIAEIEEGDPSEMLTEVGRLARRSIEDWEATDA